MKCNTCGEMNCMAHGGEAEPMDMDAETDTELNDMLADELMQAIESKDKKQILESIRAIVLGELK